MNEDDRKRKTNTRNVLLIFGLTIAAAVISMVVFMYRMLAHS